MLRAIHTRVRATIARIRDNVVRVIQRAQGKRFVHLLHIGKTGGSAVKHALSGHLVSRDQVIYLHPHDVTLADVPAGDGVIFFLREPVSRFLSGFYSRQRQGKPRYHAPWSPEEKLAFERFATPNELAVALSSTDDDERAAAGRAMADIAHVRDGYAKWLLSEEYLRSRADDLLLIGFQEELARDFELLKSKLELPAGIALPDDDVLAHRNPDNLDTKLEATATENIKRWYEEDDRFIRVCQELNERQDRVAGN